MANIRTQQAYEINLPDGWSFELLDNVAKRGSGHTPNKKIPAYWNGGIKWISLADSDKLDRRYITTTDKEISELGIKNSSAVLHPPGTVVLSRDAGVGKSAITASEMAVSQHFIAWICGSRLYNLYLYYWLQYMKPEFERIAIGSTIKTIGLPYFKKLCLPVPPLPEQRKIAEILNTWDEAIDLTEQLMAAKQRRKQALMQRLLTGQVRFPGFEEDWRTIQLQELGTIIRGASPRPKGDPRYYGGNVPRLMVEDVTRDGKHVTPCIDFLTEEGALKSRPCQKGTLTVVCSGTVGIPSFLAVDACIHDGFLAIIDLKHNLLDDNFLYYQLFHLQNTLERSATHGGVFTNLTTTILKEFEIQLPALDEQHHIAAVLTVCDDELVLHQQKLAALRRQKQGLMQQLLTGKIRVNPG